VGGASISSAIAAGGIRYTGDWGSGPLALAAIVRPATEMNKRRKKALRMMTEWRIMDIS
jgi:hypothetical protein